MDDLRFAGIVRATRIRRRWRQVDLARSAATSRGTISRIERGLVEEVAFGTLRAVCQSLEIRLELLPRTRHADAERAVNERHAALAEHVVAWLGELEGWTVRPEVSFSFYADRGVVDVVGWHQTRRAILILELKTEIIDIGELLGTLDRKRRVGLQIARLQGWDATTVGVGLLIADSMTNRRRVREHVGTLRAALPQGAREVRAWVRDPVGELRGLRFVSDARQASVRSRFASPRRVSAARGPAMTRLHRETAIRRA